MEGFRGSSPRVRGTAPHHTRPIASARFIPARAGNGIPPAPAPSQLAVHPRACGERFCATRNAWRMLGSSPRVRGTEAGGPGREFGVRFIPARAGNGLESIARSDRVSVHPRACGERSGEKVRQMRNVGSSPRVRGTVVERKLVCVERRFIPARAGNGPARQPDGMPDQVHPRACGERLVDVAERDAKAGSSPRVRGTGCGAVRFIRASRFIPARAGNG